MSLICNLKHELYHVNTYGMSNHLSNHNQFVSGVTKKIKKRHAFQTEEMRRTTIISILQSSLGLDIEENHDETIHASP